MPDHLHLLASGLNEDSDLQTFMKDFKQRSGFQFKAKAGQQLWQRYFYDHVLRSEDKWEAVAWYIWMNPVRKGLCDNPSVWPHSGSQEFAWQKLMKPVGQEWVPPWKKQP
jgi:putative transposase